MKPVITVIISYLASGNSSCNTCFKLSPSLSLALFLPLSLFLSHHLLFLFLAPISQLIPSLMHFSYLSLLSVSIMFPRLLSVALSFSVHRRSLFYLFILANKHLFPLLRHRCSVHYDFPLLTYQDFPLHSWVSVSTRLRIINDRVACILAPSGR